nr:peptidoglycan DD-metalloendopeptidase family protein [Vibrio gangliei]
MNPSKNDRGSYKGSYYVVQKGDSVYFISYLADKDVNDIIRFNRLKPPYTIHPGQKLNLWRSVYVPPAFDGTGAGDSQPTANSSTKVANKQSTSPVVQPQSKEYVEPQKTQNNNNTVTQSTSNNDKVERWVWPTRGRVISKFAVGDQGNKGIDIAGQRGQDVVATASGVVVYAGNALRGYGNLIIIKHNDDYLSAYAHNDRLNVQEGQSVKTGQKIASMGSTGTNSVRLHFEIRYKGKSVNPESYLK